MLAVSTWQDIVDMFYAAVQDTEASQTWFTKARLESWANECLWEMAEHANPINKVIEWTATPGTSGYEVNSAGHGTLALLRVEIDDEQIPPITVDKLWSKNSNWQQTTGLPRWYYRDYQDEFDTTGLVVQLWPTPDAANDVRVIVSAVPDAVDNDAMDSVIHLPLWAVPGILWGMLASAYTSESRRQNLGTAAHYRRMYYDVIDRLKARSAAKLREQLVYGAGDVGRRGPDWLGLLPPDGIPYP